VIANALSAGFQRMVHFVCPVPVGSSERVTRYKHFNAVASVGKCPRAHTAPVSSVEGFDRVGGANYSADLNVVVQEGDELVPGVSHSLTIAAYFTPQRSVISSNAARAAVGLGAGWARCRSGLMSRLSASQSRLDARRNVLRMRCTILVRTARDVGVSTVSGG